MKNPTKILIGVIVVALIGAGIYFGNTKLQKGSFKIPKLLLPDLTIYDINTEYPANGSSNNKILWRVTTQNKGACFKDSDEISKKVKVQLWGTDIAGTLIKAKPTTSDNNDYFGYLWTYDVCGKGWVWFTFDKSYPLVNVYATIDSFTDPSKNEILESNENNNSRSEKGHVKWVEE